MTLNIVECSEFSAIQIGIEHLLVNGEIKIDPRISEKGYINVALNKGQVVFRADRHIGLIPINEKFAIRVKPRVQIANITHMLVKSGVAPVALPEYSRSYLPRLESGLDAERAYARSLVTGVEHIARRGLLKSYSQVAKPPAWRGRLLISQTVKRYVSRNIGYKHAFEFSTLSENIVENIALKEALIRTEAWLNENDRYNPICGRAKALLPAMSNIPRWNGTIADLIVEIGRRIPLLPSYYGYYRDPLWTAYLLLQSKLPDVSAGGFVSMDSLIIDFSKVFEAYIRRALIDRAAAKGWVVRDGNLKPYKLFDDTRHYEVRPDIIITEGSSIVAVLDVKYKPDPKESDRYELLSFLDALGAKAGGFICPQKQNDSSQYIGKTVSGKRMSLLRFDLAATDLEAECDRLFENIQKLTTENFQFH